VSDVSIVSRIDDADRLLAEANEAQKLDKLLVQQENRG
jgi:hypothetical protein